MHEAQKIHVFYAPDGSQCVLVNENGQQPYMIPQVR